MEKFKQGDVWRGGRDEKNVLEEYLLSCSGLNEVPVPSVGYFMSYWSERSQNP